jgi:hypothetical protein
MSRTAPLMLLGSLSVFAFGTTGALAASSSQVYCETTLDGQWDKATKTCTTTSTTTAGNSDTTWTDTTTTNAHGNLKNPNTPPPSTDCTGPGGSKPAPKC